MVQQRMFRIIREKGEKTELQLLEDPSQWNEVNLNDVRHEATGYFGNK
jgi:hypothetical protein